MIMSAYGEGTGLATVLFNHDVTVVLYFAAWISGCHVVPINVEEAHGEEALYSGTFGGVRRLLLAHVIGELKDLQRELPVLAPGDCRQ